jgi:hypothetical protein|tara:strand:+ start:533 stop:709 length:177 start_codon:yes stop_codon:yes gene_type:complete
MIQHHNLLDNIINSKQEILVTVDGEVQSEGKDYENVENQIVFKTAPKANAVIKVYKRN